MPLQLKRLFQRTSPRVSSFTPLYAAVPAGTFSSSPRAPESGNKITVENPIVEMTGDEMANELWTLVKRQVCGRPKLY